MKRRSFLQLGAAALGASVMPYALGQGFPKKPINMIVPFAPGGNLDTVARLVSPSLSSILGEPIVVQNRSGAGGSIGAGEVARADADGHTLLVSAPNALCVLPHIVKTTYTLDSFAPVGLVSSTSLVLVVNAADTRFKDAQSLLNHAKKTPKGTSCGYAGIATTNHVAMMLLESAAGVEWNGISYKGSGPALLDLLGGQIDVVIDQLSSSISHIKAGKLRALAVLSRERDPQIPDVPTLHEAGVAGFNVATTTGIFAPAGTPKAVVQKLNATLNKALADEQLKAKLLAAGSVVRTASPDEFKQMLLAEQNAAMELVKSGKLKAT